ncbi:MAG: ATP-binding cassette domain-containing protein [Pseudomonadota bacterium]
MPRRLLDIDNVFVTLWSEDGSQAVLRGLDFHLNKGEHVAICGGNGAGKSTLLKLIRGDAWADRNMQSVTWHTSQGPDTSRITGHSMTGIVSCAMQERYVQQEWLITGQEVLHTAFGDTNLLYTATTPDQEATTVAMAERLCCSELLDRPIMSLSQGQLRILLLARALLRQPEILLLDEYLDGLDTAMRQRVLGVLEHVAKDTTIILTAHRPEGIPEWIAKRLYLYDGILHEIPQTVEIEDKKIECTQAHCHAHTSDTKSTEKPLISLVNATVFVDRAEILHNITWSMRRGEHWMIHGSNGAGKSTFLNLLAGGDTYPAYGGTISRHLPRHGGDIVDLPSIRRAIRLVSDLGQATYGYNLTGLELVLSGGDNVVGMYRNYDEAEIHEAHELLAHMDATHLAMRHIRTLSTGQLRRLLLARALMGKPEIVLLDEPCSGLDAQFTKQILGLLDAMSDEVHFVLVSHHPSDRLQCISHDLYLENGYVVEK